MKEKYGLIGYPLGHSFSRQFFTEKFEREGIDAEYMNFEIPEASMLLDVVKKNPELRGLNCTIPHKQAIIPLLDDIDPMAARIGAVNVIKIIRSDDAGSASSNTQCANIRMKGYNSDIIGFMESIKPLLQHHHKRALVLGTGGASRAICVGLELLGIEWRYVSRTPRQGQLAYEDITPEVIKAYPLIVNCSPVGMYPKVDACPPLPYEAMSSETLLYDLVYNPLETQFMKQGAAYGAVTKNGLEMLHLQALASWKFWNEVTK